MRTTVRELARSSDEAPRFAAVAMYSTLLVAYVLMAADRYLLPVLAASVRQEFGLSLARTGILTTIFTAGLGVGGIPTGYLLARWKRKSVQIAGVAIFSVAIAATAVAGGFWTMVLCLALAGVGMAMLATSMFALAASYFYRYRAAAIGSVNFCYGLGGIVGPAIAGILLSRTARWRVPVTVFGGAGLLAMVAIAAIVRPSFSETQAPVRQQTGSGGADTLLNRNTILLTALTILHGLALYGFLGMYPTFLREHLNWNARLAGFVMSFFGLGALLSILGGFVGDRLRPRLVLGGGFVCSAVLGHLMFSGTSSVPAQEAMAFGYGAVGSGLLYVNLAGYHVKSLNGSLAGRGSGVFVTSLYGAAAAAGSLMGWLANYAGWSVAGDVQIALLSFAGAVLALVLREREMAA